jgi:hypothetical protein
MSYADKRDRAIGILMEAVRAIPPDAIVSAVLHGCNSELHEVAEETYEWLATLKRFPSYPKREESDGSL